MLAGWALLGLTLIAAAPPAYCTGQRITDDFGAIDLRRVRYEFPSGAAVITLAADLAAGRLDRASIAAVCPSTRSQ
jgi:hypothetical protein